MNYFYIGIAVYLVAGLVLTRSILKNTSMRMRFRDAVLGAVATPILFTAMLAFELFEDLWARLLVMLDYDPPEEMRAGPKEPVREQPKIDIQ